MQLIILIAQLKLNKWVKKIDFWLNKKNIFSLIWWSFVIRITKIK
jgi:hypothetical protein